MPAGRPFSKDGRPRTGLSLTIVLSAAIHVALFALLAYHIAANEEETVVFSPPYSVSLVSGEEPGEGGQDGVEPPSITEKAPPAPPVETETEAVTVPVEKPAEVKKETPKPSGKTPEKPAAPAVTEEKKKPVEERKTETTEDLNSVIEKIRKKVEAEEAVKKKEEEDKRLAERNTDAAKTPAPPKVPAATTEAGKAPAPGKPGGGNPYGYDNVFTAGGSGKGVPDADLSAYYNEVWKRIRSVWAIPEGLSVSKLSTVYGIRIDREGRIVDVWMESGSGNGAFDDSAFRAIKKADPLPPIPDKYTDITMDMGIRFHSDKR